MSLSVQVGLLFAVATALCSIVGFLYKHRGAVESPPVDPRRPIASSVRRWSDSASRRAASRSARPSR